MSKLIVSISKEIKNTPPISAACIIVIKGANEYPKLNQGNENSPKFCRYSKEIKKTVKVIGANLGRIKLILFIKKNKTK